MKSRMVMAAIALSALLLAACAASPGRIRQTRVVPALEAEHGLALEGYDAVAYFEVAQAQRGTEQFSYRWRGARWHFASLVRRDAFAANPERYAPQYGNYCAFAVSRGTTAHGDPRLWAVVGDRLYLNNNRFAQQLWEQDRADNISAADQNWPLLPKQALP